MLIYLSIIFILIFIEIIFVGEGWKDNRGMYLMFVVFDFWKYI